MSSRDVDTVLAVVLADDLREQLETASTLPPPPASFLTPCGTYTEAPWRFDPGNSELIDITLSGYVDGDEVRRFYAEDLDGNPIKIPDAFMSDALADLIAASRKSS